MLKIAPKPYLHVSHIIHKYEFHLSRFGLVIVCLNSFFCFEYFLVFELPHSSFCRFYQGSQGCSQNDPIWYNCFD